MRKRSTALTGQVRSRFDELQVEIAWTCGRAVVHRKCAKHVPLRVADGDTPAGAQAIVHHQVSRRAVEAEVGRDVFDHHSLLGVSRRSARTDGWADLQPVDDVQICSRQTWAGTLSQAMPVVIQQHDRAVAVRRQLFDRVRQRVEPRLNGRSRSSPRPPTLPLATMLEST